MIFANVYVGTNANDGTGDPIRTAFQKIDQNFANILAQGNAVVGVSSVAGRTGDIILTVNDVVGAAAISYVNTQTNAYTMGNYQNWTSNVTTISSALDQLAQRLTNAGF
jgi:hypothetical protein